MGHLHVSLGSLPILALPVPAGVIRLGRSPDNDIILSLPEVAEHHAELRVEVGGIRLLAVGGETLEVDGKPATEARLDQAREVALGGYRLHWRQGEAGPEDGADLTASGGPAAERPGEAAGARRTAPLLPAEPPDGTSRADRLRVLAGPDAGLEIRLGPGPLVLGRGTGCDVALRDETVSWRHAVLERRGAELWLRDLGSRNGTFLEGRSVESAAVHAGGRIRLGCTTLTLEPGVVPGRAEPPGASRLAEMIGGSARMQDVFGRIREAAGQRLPVLLLGETGTGKELAARALHALAARAKGPFIPVNCAAIPREMLEAELFGHARGAFTGATGERQGAFAAADGGTIFLDEIAELPLELQPKLLRVLDDGEVPRLGGPPVSCDFRAVAATNRDLPAEAAAGRFRRDLLFRLGVLVITMPPLRERPEDIPELAAAFLAAVTTEAAVPILAPDALERLRAHRWSGNVRELRNVLLRAAIGAGGGAITAALVERALGEGGLDAVGPPAEEGTLRRAERDAVRNALRDCGGNRRAAARRLGIAESTLYEKIRRHGLGGEGTV